jgi:hypothetical protein
MFGCIGRMGCGLLLMILGAAGWHYRDVWMPKAKELITAEMPWDHDEWRPLTAAGARRTELRMEQLKEPTGPAYVNVSGAEFAAWTLRRSLDGIFSVDSVPEALVADGTLYLRMRVKLSDLGGRDQLGAIAGLFGDAEPLTIAGRIEGVHPGLARYRPTEVAVKDLKIPPAALIRLLTRWSPGIRPDSVGGSALAIPLPTHVADVRVTGRRVTLYKAAP